MGLEGPWIKRSIVFGGVVKKGMAEEKKFASDFYFSTFFEELFFGVHAGTLDSSPRL